MMPEDQAVETQATNVLEVVENFGKADLSDEQKSHLVERLWDELVEGDLMDTFDELVGLVKRVQEK